MCGIAGWVGAERPAEAAQHELMAMCDAIRHRGPDDAGYLIGPGIALGMRRLSIIDLAGGHQPIGNEDGDIQIVFNGEIYNYRELQDRLRRAGHRFATNSDTETIVHLYEEDGVGVLEALRGMFAFALWDSRRGRLLLARDRLGKKPLYYTPREQGIAFASELKSLLQLPDLRRELDPGAIADFLALGYVPDPQSIFRGVHKLPPGHFLTWERERGVQITQYWSPLRPEDSTIDERQAVEEIRRLLAESIRYRLIADVPLGAFLSGGLDSSAVVAEMARQMDRPVRTFSIGFDEPDYNEAPYAAAAARALRTEHTELVVSPDVDTLTERIVAAFDEPFADSSAIPTFLVSELARNAVTVVLSGDGGDELFGGYTRYLDLGRRNFAISGIARATLRWTARRLPHGAWGRNRLLELSRNAEGRYAGMVAQPLAEQDGGVARPELLAVGCEPEDVLSRWFRQVPPRDLQTRATLVDMASYLPGDILTKVDRMSMAVSLEARVPLLDHKLVEFAASLPGRLKFRHGQGKWIWKEAIRGLVPDEVLARRKQGFAVPLRHWFRGPLRHRVEDLLQPDSPIYEYVAPAAVARVVREHLTGRRDHPGLLWRLLVLGLWLRSLPFPGETAGQPPKRAFVHRL